MNVTSSTVRSHVCDSYLRRGVIFREDRKSKNPAHRVYKAREVTETERKLNGVQYAHWRNRIRPAVYSQIAGAELAYRTARLPVVFPGSIIYHGQAYSRVELLRGSHI